MARTGRGSACAWTAVFISCLVITGFLQYFVRFSHTSEHLIDQPITADIEELSSEKEPEPGPQPGPSLTLVIYVFSNTDAEYKNNLRFFIQHGVAEDDACEYLIVVQTADGRAKPPDGVDLPLLPSNARYVFHQNGCYDWGTIGWVLETGKQDWKRFKYFIFMNSSVRGPFIPPFAQGSLRWYQFLINRLSMEVKLVGPTISCEGSPKDGNVNGEWRTNPHVQSYVLATDQTGLQAWFDDGQVFRCYSSMWDTIYYSELGSSLVLLERGWNIDSFMVRYQGVDWREKANWDCNGRVNPYGEHYYDGISVAPFEVMFVKVKDTLLQNQWSAAVAARKYGDWYSMTSKSSSSPPDVSTNAWKSSPWPIKMPTVLYMKTRGAKCFDHNYYHSTNLDLKSLSRPEDLWDHWVSLGQFEGRPFRFSCEVRQET